MHPRPSDASRPRRWGIGRWAAFGVMILVMSGLAAWWSMEEFLHGAFPDQPGGQCVSNLRCMGGFLTEVATSHRKSENRGQAFLLQLATRGMIRPQDVRVFVCPKDPEHARVDDPEFAKRIQSIDLRNPDPGITSYAVRDFARAPLASHASGKEPWALCPWHKDGIPVLYDDGSVVFHRREDLGLRPGETLVLGPDAKNEFLREFLPLQR